MPAKELHPEIWAKVIAHLRRPLPPPTGKNDRPSIRQGDLAIVMRVNKLFNNLAAPRLYSVVVSDHLPSLLYNIDQPTATSGIRSKSQLLCYIKRLFLEYCDKSTPTYDSLTRHGGAFFSLVGHTEPQLPIALLSAESNWITCCLERIVQELRVWQQQNIESLATCFFFERQYTDYAGRTNTGDNTGGA